MSEADEIEQARALFQSFHRRAARPSEIIKVGGLTSPVIALEVGSFTGIGYRSSGTHEKFFHEFESPLPKVFVRFDGRQVYVIGGAYVFKSSGFNG